MGGYFMEQTIAVRANRNGIDLFKFIMALCVVAIHTHPLEGVTAPFVIKLYKIVVQCAVPFFFLATGYLLACRMDWPYNSQASIQKLTVYLWKTVKLYLIWSLIYMPLAIYDYVHARFSLLKGTMLYLRGLFLLGEHYNSYILWYLLSTIYAVACIVICLRRNLSPWTILCGGGGTNWRRNFIYSIDRLQR